MEITKSLYLLGKQQAHLKVVQLWAARGPLDPLWMASSSASLQGRKTKGLLLSLLSIGGTGEQRRSQAVCREKILLIVS